MTKNKIMIVDDSNTVRISLRYFLEIEGYQAIEAQDGKEAYDIIKKQMIYIFLSSM